MKIDRNSHIGDMSILTMLKNGFICFRWVMIVHIIYQRSKIATIQANYSMAFAVVRVAKYDSTITNRTFYKDI